MRKNTNREAVVGADEVRVAQRTIASVCHDLNNPLSIISGNAQLLRQIAASMNLGDDVQDSLRDIERAVEQVSVQLERLSRLNDRLSKGSGQ